MHAQSAVSRSQNLMLVTVFCLDVYVHKRSIKHASSLVSDPDCLRSVYTYLNL